MTAFGTILGRILLSALFIMAGLQKAGDPAGTAAFIKSGGLPGILVWPTIALEILGGLMVLLGFYSRLAAIALALFCIAAGVLYHLIPSQGMEGIMAELNFISFLKNMTIAGGFFLLAALGPGKPAINDN